MSKISTDNFAKHLDVLVCEEHHIHFKGTATPHMLDMELAAQSKGGINVDTPACGAFVGCGYNINVQHVTNPASSCVYCSSYFLKDLDIVCLNEEPKKPNPAMDCAVLQILGFFESHLGDDFFAQNGFEGYISELASNTNNAVDSLNGLPGELFPRFLVRKVEGEIVEFSYCIYTKGETFPRKYDLQNLVEEYGTPAMPYITAKIMAQKLGLHCDFRVCSGDRVAIPAHGNDNAKVIKFKTAFHGTAIACRMFKAESVQCKI